jgi:hypothetical protein
MFLILNFFIFQIYINGTERKEDFEAVQELYSGCPAVIS